jgi:hypothetical protein
LCEKVNNTSGVSRTFLKEVFMLSKVLATLVATMAVAFAGYTLVSDSHGSKCCMGSLPAPTTVSSDCCSESAMPSCCQESAVTAEAACADVCPAAKAAAAAKDAAPATDAPK